jgi:uncharacterized membrane protein YfcA
MHSWEYVVFAVAGFGSAILSGIAGAGGGFIMTPLMILLGLTPAQSVASGKFAGLSVTVGSLFGMRSAKGHITKRRVIPVMVLALLVGLLVPYVIKTLDGQVYRVILGVILLLMIPVMVYKQVGLKPHQTKGWQKLLGGILLSVALFLQGVFSGGLGSLVNIVLMGLLGMTALEANLTKRWSQLILNVTVILGVIGSGLVIWSVVAVGVVSTFAGSYWGGHIAVKKGDGFIMKVMIGLMVVSALMLIFGA